MKSQIRTALVFLSGIAVGGAGFGVLHAQTKAPAAYWVTETMEFSDQAAYGKAIAGTPPTLAPYGGRYLARGAGAEGGKVVADNGPPPKRITIIAFDSLEKAQQWQHDPAEVAVATEARKNAKTRSYFAEGVAN
jgi:uncharacterized protein (DUF1330 family)